MDISNFENVYVIDCGKNNATISHNGNPVTIISHKEILNLPTIIPKHSLVVSEYAHLGCPREEYSMSMPLTDVELKMLYDGFTNNYITLKLFPQKSTPRASSYSNLEKGDDQDPIAIYRLLRDFPQISLMNPPRSFNASKKIEEFWHHKDITNKILNIARMSPKNSVDGYDVWGKNNDQNTKWILDNIHYIYNNLSDNARDCFGFSHYSSTHGAKKNRGKLKIKSDNKWLFKMGQIYTILSVLRNHKGELRKRESTNNFLSNNDAKRYIFCMTAFHHRGGVARSNLYFHGARNWIIKKGKDHNLDFRRKVKTIEDNEEKSRQIRRGHFTQEEDIVFLKYRRIYSNSCMELYKLFKYMLSDNFDANINIEKNIKQLDLIYN